MDLNWVNKSINFLAWIQIALISLQVHRQQTIHC